MAGNKHSSSGLVIASGGAVAVHNIHSPTVSTHHFHDEASLVTVTKCNVQIIFLQITCINLLKIIS